MSRSNDDEEIPPDIIERVLGSFSPIPPQAARRAGRLVVFNENGRRTPIFWCFNHFGEPYLLAARLGADQPLYAMHSFQGVVEKPSQKRRYRSHLANLYTQSILDHAAGPRIVIGGNCQSALIAEAVARNVAARTGRHPLLMMLEHDPAAACEGPLLLLFGDQSRAYNPFLREADPVSRWRERHRNVAWGILKGAHGTYFREPGILDLTGFLRRAVDVFDETGRIPDGAMQPAAPADAM
ncbi:hypothetical protein ASG52_24500 [Methylobacterium sp. Leaf456]|uniref:hypothetical protein n=1 Tax=Methylobacterium sp. Leaf456 TaxID=1736382 RepID=UPI0006F337E7|nr:hypothetical protein [Methylobacterium sp. Leaf456]KQT56084.1 hypothetical protein ASG52_24500 [Methylobacterium sp. Leaf456]